MKKFHKTGQGECRAQNSQPQPDHPEFTGDPCAPSKINDALIDHPFGRKSVEGRDPGYGKGKNKGSKKSQGHGPGKAAQIFQILLSALLLHGSCTKKETSFINGIVDHVKETGCYSEGGPKTESQDHITHL